MEISESHLTSCYINFIILYNFTEIPLVTKKETEDVSEDIIEASNENALNNDDVETPQQNDTG